MLERSPAFILRWGESLYWWGGGGGVSWASRESVTVKLEQKTKKFNYYKTEEISTLMWDLIAYLVDNNDKIEA